MVAALGGPGGAFGGPVGRRGRRDQIGARGQGDGEHRERERGEDERHPGSIALPRSEPSAFAAPTARSAQAPKQSRTVMVSSRRGPTDTTKALSPVSSSMRAT